MNVETGTEAAQFPEEEYINGIFVAAQALNDSECILTLRFLSKSCCHTSIGKKNNFYFKN